MIFFLGVITRNKVTSILGHDGGGRYFVPKKIVEQKGVTITVVIVKNGLLT